MAKSLSKEPVDEVSDQEKLNKMNRAFAFMAHSGVKSTEQKITEEGNKSTVSIDTMHIILSNITEKTKKQMKE